MPLDRFQLQQNTSAASNPARYLTDTAPFDQLNAISAAQGLVPVISNKFDGVTSVSVNRCFTSAYQNYRVLLTLTGVSADSDFTLRLRSGGADSVSSLYDNIFPGFDVTAVASNSIAGGQSAWNVGESDNGSAVPLPAKTIRYRLSLDFFSPFELENTVILGQYTFINKAATASVVRYGSGQYQHNISFDGFSFISSVALSISGIVRVYGYKV